MAWIRSQNKMRLANAVAFGLDKLEYFQLRAFVGGLSDYFLMGEFDSELKALEELSRITAWLEGGGQGIYQVSPRE